MPSFLNTPADAPTLTPEPRLALEFQSQSPGRSGTEPPLGRQLEPEEAGYVESATGTSKLTLAPL